MYLCIYVFIRNKPARFSIYLNFTAWLSGSSSSNFCACSWENTVTSPEHCGGSDLFFAKCGVILNYGKTKNLRNDRNTASGCLISSLVSNYDPFSAGLELVRSYYCHFGGSMLKRLFRRLRHLFTTVICPIPSSQLTDQVEAIDHLKMKKMMVW